MSTNGAAMNGQLPNINGTNGTNGTSPMVPIPESNPQVFDFRSDVVTRRTPAMTASILSTSEGDDVFGDDSTTSALESLIAELTGFEAALLVMSGTMGNQLCIRTHMTAPPHSIVADARSHVMGWEAGGLASLTGALAIPITPSNGHHLTLSDIKQHTILSRDIHACPTALLSLENTLNGTILPLSTLHSISSWSRSLSPPLKIHLDGARLWEACAAGAGSLAQYCACVDSVSLCFSKGLGAPIGSIIAGSKPFIQRARHIRKGLGGGTRQAGWISAPARVAVDETFLGGKLAASHARARDIARMWTDRGGTLTTPTETNMVWLDLGALRRPQLQQEEESESKIFTEKALQKGIIVNGGRLVVHYQICDEAVRRLGTLFDSLLFLNNSSDHHQQEEESSKNLKRKAEQVREPVVE